MHVTGQDRDGRTPGDGGGPGGAGRRALDESERSSREPRAVLLVSGDARLRRRLTDRLASVATIINEASTAADAVRLSSGFRHEIAVVDASLPGSVEAIRSLAGEPSRTRSVLYASEPTAGLLLASLRAGALDVLIPEEGEAALVERVRRSIELAEATARREAREQRLERLCRKLNGARREVSSQIGGLCTDLIGACRELSGQLGEVAVASELNSLLRQELDVESLLRTYLEYVLARVGSTNAGIFLPTSTGEYSLGAYINYDCPRDTAELMLEEFADTLAPAFEAEPDAVRLVGMEQIEARLGEAAHWLDGHALVAIPCHEAAGADDEPECLAVIALFRDARRGFDDETLGLLRLSAELFGRQLARVIRVHHRHTPEELSGEGPFGLPGFGDGGDGGERDGGWERDAA